MSPAQNNDKLVDSLRTHFVSNYSPATAWGNAIAYSLLLPQLRGFWPFSSVDETGKLYDLSGQGRTLSNNNTVAFGSYGLYPYADFVLANTEYFSRTDEAGTSITDALTLMAWLYFDAPSTGVATGLATKWLVAGNQRSYELLKTSTNTLQFLVSSNGTANTPVTSSVTYATGTWFHMVGRYTPSSELAIFINGTKDTNTTSIPASIFDSTADFVIGALSGGSNPFDGRATLVSLCAAALSDAQILAYYHHTRALFGG